MIISIEGLDFSGKTLAVNYLKERRDVLEEVHGKPVHFCREPGGTKIGEAIRDIIVGDNEACQNTIMFLFQAARAQLIHELEDALANDELVIFDRFYDSSTIYQGLRFRLAPISFIQAMNMVATKDQKAALTIFLTITLETYKKRISAASDDRVNRLDPTSLADIEQTISGYREIARVDCNRVVELDANGEIDSVNRHVLAQIVGYITTHKQNNK